VESQTKSLNFVPGLKWLSSGKHVGSLLTERNLFWFLK